MDVAVHARAQLAGVACVLVTTEVVRGSERVGDRCDARRREPTRDLGDTGLYFGAGVAVLVSAGNYLRGRFRDGYSEPKAFEPNVPALVRVPLQDVLHTFQKGHRLMVQVQSTWFPLVDRNPQVFLPNMYVAKESDCVRAVHRVWREGEKNSRVLVGSLP